MLIDPDGKAPQWIPVIQGDRLVIQKEKGDNAKSLASFLHVSQGVASSLYASMSDKGTIDPVSQHGSWVIDKAIKDTKNNPDDYELGLFNQSNYDCYESSLACLNNRKIDYERIIEGDELNNKLSNPDNGYQVVTGETNKYVFAKTLILMGDSEGNTVHSAKYLGTSRDGTVYKWTKNGGMEAPKIDTLKNVSDRWLATAVEYFNRY